MRTYALLIVMAITAGCNPIAPYRPPATYAPVEWKKETDPQTPPMISNACIQDWWNVFDDPVLDYLECLAVNNNYSLQAAVQNYLQAKAQAQVAGAPLYPSIGFDPVFTKQEGLFIGAGPSGTTGSGAVTGGSIAATAIRGVFGQYTLPLKVNYEVDIWNQVRNGYYAALFTEEAQLEALGNVLLSITCDLAENYFILRSLDSEREVLLKSRVTRKNAVEINQARYDAGLVNYTDVTRAQTELANVEADYQDNLRQRSLQENILAVLTGTPAPEFSVEFSPLHNPPPVIPAGIPATVISQRPDIRQAERTIASDWANIGVAYANFFPSLNLAGSIGYQSPFWTNLLDWKARFWSYTISIAQVIFDGGSISGNLMSAEAQYLQDIANYQEKVLVAFREVEDALANIKYRYQQGVFLLESVHSSNQTFDLSQVRYDKGLVTYLDVVDAERQLLDAQRSYVRVFGGQYTATVQLIRSLGGSWETSSQDEDEEDEEICVDEPEPDCSK